MVSRLSRTNETSGNSGGEHEQASVGDVAFMGRMLAHGVGLVVRETIKSMRDEMRAAPYAPPNGTLAERARRASGFVLWAIDGTRPPQASELRALHDEEKAGEAYRQLTAVLSSVIDEGIEGEIDLETRNGMILNRNEGETSLRYDAIRPGGDYYVVLSLYPEVDGTSQLPDISYVYRDGQSSSPPEPASAGQINVFARELNSSTLINS